MTKGNFSLLQNLVFHSKYLLGIVFPQCPRYSVPQAPQKYSHYILIEL